MPWNDNDLEIILKWPEMPMYIVLLGCHWNDEECHKFLGDNSGIIEDDLKTTAPSLKRNTLFEIALT